MNMGAVHLFTAQYSSSKIDSPDGKSYTNGNANCILQESNQETNFLDEAMIVLGM